MGRGISLLFEYETPKVVQITNLKVGVTQRIIQLLLLVYVVCWVMIYEKAYQVTDEAKSAVTTKVKGIAFTNYTGIPTVGRRVWDIPDFVIPPLEKDALFVATNIITTHAQRLSKCAESISAPGSKCEENSDCTTTEISHLGSGVNTGKCLKPRGRNIGTCEIYSWCPLENDTLPLGNHNFMFPMVENFTLLIKNDITFEKFNVHRRNIQNWVSKKFLRTCLYDKDHPENRFCPIFRLGTILKEAGVDKSLYIKGGVVGIDINWECDLDWDVKYCIPEYKFSRLDDSRAPIAKGFNFRYANYYFVNNTLHRDLYKTYGIRFLINVHGIAGKFHLLPLTMNIGSGLALLGLAPTICDIIALNLLRSKDIYQRAKFETIEDERQQLEARKRSRTKTSGKVTKDSTFTIDLEDTADQSVNMV